MYYASVFRNTIFQILARFMSAISTLLITILILHQFGLSGFGDFTKIVTFVTFFYQFVDFGLNAVFLQKDDTHKHFSTLLYIRIVIAFCLFIVVNILAFLLPYNEILHIGFPAFVRLGIIIFSLTLFTQSIFLSCAAFFQKTMRYDSFLLATSLGSIVTLLLVYASTLLGFGLYYILLAFVAGGVSSAFVAILKIWKNLFLKEVEYKMIVPLLKESLPIGLMLVFNLIYFRADMFLLALFKQSNDVGIYAGAYRFFDVLIALPLFLSNSLYPHLLANKKNYRNNILFIFRYLLIAIIASVILVGVLWGLAPYGGFLAKDLNKSIGVFRILLVSLPAFFGSSILQWFLISYKQQTFLFFLYASIAVVNIILNLVFVPVYSYSGSAVITGVTEGIVFLVLSGRIITSNKKFSK